MTSKQKDVFIIGCEQCGYYFEHKWMDVAEIHMNDHNKQTGHERIYFCRRKDGIVSNLFDGKVGK